MENSKTLLRIVDILKSKYEKLSKSDTGFNIFTVLRKEDDEVNLHSKFIVELLSNVPHYSEKFLKLFLENIGIEQDYFIGNVAVLKEHRNIDILLKDEKNVIIIENKIYAEDQEEQLSRYYELMKNKNNKVQVFYLTLDGRDPSNQSLGYFLCSASEPEDGKVQVINISYKKDISSWIEGCIKESATNPIIRETLVQYLEVVNRLTGQTESKDFYNEVATMLQKSSNNMKLANDIKIGFDLAINNLKILFWKDLESKLKESPIYDRFKEDYYEVNNGKHSKEMIEKNKKLYGLMYSIAKLNGSYELILVFEVDHYFYWGYGIIKNGQSKGYSNKPEFSELKTMIQNEISNYSGNIDYSNEYNTDFWLAYSYPKPDFNYRFPDEEFFKLADKNYREKKIDEVVKAVSEITGKIIQKIPTATR